jgi:ribulose-5-phosphate 4-epimerase/fuculose-1-phosphate aldolase
MMYSMPLKNYAVFLFTRQTGMENYQGIKFAYRRINNAFSCAAAQLIPLNQWAFLLSQLGLTPVHAEGAYGNQSCRTGHISFLITKAGMIPTEGLTADNYCHILDLDERTNAFHIEGPSIPSSESMLHNLLYRSQPRINAVLHGHSTLFLKYAQLLKIPTTKTFQPYGTHELALSALELLDESETTRFFILKDHGFVALGNTVEEAGRVTLEFFKKLIMLL